MEKYKHSYNIERLGKRKRKRVRESSLRESHKVGSVTHHPWGKVGREGGREEGVGGRGWFSRLNSGVGISYSITNRSGNNIQIARRRIRHNVAQWYSFLDSTAPVPGSRLASA